MQEGMPAGELLCSFPEGQRTPAYELMLGLFAP